MRDFSPFSVQYEWGFFFEIIYVLRLKKEFLMS